MLSRLQNAQPEYSYTLVLKKNGVRTPLPAVAQSIGAYIDWEGGVHHEVLEDKLDELLGVHAKKKE